ncbi:OstA-like protein [Flavobacterium arcticum]|uniref:OstA-like protein n=1 Tax=Flavobacterium arcticum TaxID=1784713 RepID=A0A345HEF5_9FLAO|nr:OstA-like protein [Flavobacterium arcticum]AXG74965.1 OstA-like protein [Flavobacterium arcticum]KAF2506517.1 OstA-like protein [Flavobacterium arcticum]
MKKLLIYIGILFIAFGSINANAQKKIRLIDTEHLDGNENEIPGAVVFTGDVQFEHNGATIWCNKAYLFEQENYAKLFGDVRIIQGDTIHMNSEYAEYNGNKNFAFASGDVVMKSPDMRLTTDTLYFDRASQQAYYNSYGTIVNEDNTLKSKSGRYYINQKKYQFLTAVTLTNPKYILKSNHLDYYTNSGHAYVFGPTTITSKENYIYTEKGVYDTKKNFAHLLTNSYIKYDTQLIEGDSIYYDRNREFSSATNNVKVTDTVNKYNVRGHYAEVYKQKDSLFITKHAVAVTLVEADSLYTHAKRIVITGKEGQRVVRGYNNARFYKTDMSGKCDSIHSDEERGLTQLIGRPVVWNGDSQMTGDVIHLISNSKTEQIDSLKVLNNAFIIQKDTLGTGYNQVKGQNLYGKFKDNKLYEVDLIKNTEKIFYMYDKEDLIGIDKGVSSKIHMKLNDNQIKSIRSIKNPESQSYPDAEFPENVRKLRGFIWRGDEQIKSKEDIFPPEEKELHEQIVNKTTKEKKVEDKPMEIMQETLDYDKNNPKKPQLKPTIKKQKTTTE